MLEIRPGEQGQLGLLSASALGAPGGAGEGVGKKQVLPV